MEEGHARGVAEGSGKLCLTFQKNPHFILFVFMPLHCWDASCYTAVGAAVNTHMLFFPVGFLRESLGEDLSTFSAKSFSDARLQSNKKAGKRR